MTHNEWVQQELIKGERLNIIQANRERGIHNLRSVVSKLKKNGWEILDRRVYVVNGMGEKCMVNEYWMKEKQQPRRWSGQSIK